MVVRIDFDIVIDSGSDSGGAVVGGAIDADVTIGRRLFATVGSADCK